MDANQNTLHDNESESDESEKNPLDMWKIMCEIRKISLQRTVSSVTSANPTRATHGAIVGELGFSLEGLLPERELAPNLQNEIYESGLRAIKILQSLKTCAIDECLDKLREVIVIVESFHSKDLAVVNYDASEFERFSAWMHFRHEFNRVVGWAIPTSNMIKTIAQWFIAWKVQHPGARFIDMGAGSGAISLLLSQAGIPVDCIIAVDNSSFNYSRRFFNVIPPPEKTYAECFSDGFYTPEDVLFVAWGYGLETCVDQFVENGTQCIILHGEGEGGCTYPSASHMSEYDDWTTETVYVTPSCGMYRDYLTYNVKSPADTIEIHVSDGK